MRRTTPSGHEDPTEPVLEHGGDSGLSAISAHRPMAISLLVQEMRCEARVTGGVHVAVSSSHSTAPLHPLAVARTTGRELARDEELPESLPTLADVRRFAQPCGKCGCAWGEPTKRAGPRGVCY